MKSWWENGLTGIVKSQLLKLVHTFYYSAVPHRISHPVCNFHVGILANNFHRNWQSSCKGKLFVPNIILSDF